MIELQTLQQELIDRSITLYMDDMGKLKVRASKEALTPEISRGIKEHKASLLASLPLSPAEPEGKRIKYLDGVRFFIGYSDEEWREHRIQEIKEEEKLKNDQPLTTYWTKNATNQTPEKEMSPASVTNNTPANDRKCTVYASIQNGQACMDTGTSVALTPNCTLLELVHTIEKNGHTPDKIFICTPLPENYFNWLTDGMYTEYSTAKRGHYFDADKQEGHVARYEHRISHNIITIRTMDGWLGDAEYTPEQASKSIALLNQYLASTFTKDTIAYGTPSLTFQQIWSRENRMSGKKFELLQDDVRSLIRSSSGQGRIELLTPDNAKKIPGIFYYDGIFEYAALTWGMPTEIASHDNENIYAGKTPARYRIRYTVPTNWQHIGLFMTPREQVTGKAEDNDQWAYPGEKENGRTFETWVDGSELDIAYNLPEGMPRWDITILERIVFKSEKDSTSTKPLNNITKKLVMLREKVEQDSMVDSENAILYRLVRGMVRNILLHGIGSFNRHDRDGTIIASDTEAPDGYIGVPRRLRDNLYVYTIPGTSERYTQQFEHPEWCAIVWARCRARMVKSALSLPRETIIAIRTDAIATTTEQFQWNGNTKIGALRRKWAITKQLKAPHKFEELDKIVDQHIKEGK